MNRYQYDNVDKDVTSQMREKALKPKGINSQTYYTTHGVFKGKSTNARKALKAQKAK